MANKYIKCPIITQVEFADISATFETLEGAVPYQAGDALMTGVAGESWPIRRGRFDVTYKAQPPTKQGENGSYIKNPIPVTAVQITAEVQVPLSGMSASISGNVGDWLITASDGSQWVVQDAIFRKTYMPFEE